MSDYSLAGIPSRLAVEGEELVRFSSGRAILLQELPIECGYQFSRQVFWLRPGVLTKRVFQRGFN
jgi:hypothetical protein